MGLVDGKVAIVTGAGRGVGRGEALELAAQGAKVVVNDYGGSSKGEGGDKAPADEVVDIITSRGGEAIANYGDVGDWNDAEDLVQQAIDTFGALDIVVNLKPRAAAATWSETRQKLERQLESLIERGRK